MPTINEIVFDRGVAHQVGILRFSSGVRNRILGLLREVEDDLRDQITTRLAKIEARGVDIGPATTARLQALLGQVQEINLNGYGKISDTLIKELRAAGSFEVDFTARMLEASVGSELALLLPTATQIGTIVTAQPLSGRILSDVLGDLPRNATQRINEAIRLGLIEGQTSAQITRSIFGTAARGFDDGIQRFTRRGLAMVVNTSINHVMSRSREALFMQNRDLIGRVMWVSTLDTRTTPICQRRDKMVFPVGKGPRPPAHPNCRSTTVALLNGQKDLLGERASDVGGVPAETDYEDFLRRIQDDPAALSMALNAKQRAALFRDGGLSLDDLINDTTENFFTLDQLRQNHAEAFVRAGID